MVFKLALTDIEMKNCMCKETVIGSCLTPYSVLPRERYAEKSIICAVEKRLCYFLSSIKIFEIFTKNDYIVHIYRCLSHRTKLTIGKPLLLKMLL